MECKENRENISESNCKSINRNIVECKDDIKLWNYSVKRVLIETSWNVKRGQVIATPVENIVLIETSWNVKVFIDIEDKCQENCINRNIVECKESFPEGDLIPISVLIETSWNVKQTSSFSE